ncbi:MAG: Gfo/Idh/MocA family protein, partial [Candidatus Thorarchaeota archaeon]
SDLSKKSRKIAKDYNVKKVYQNYDIMLDDEELDAIIVALPNHLHLDAVRKVAESGKHIYLEKPMARTVEEAEKILNITEKNNLKLMMGYPMPFDSNNIEIKKKILSHDLGDIEIFTTNFVSSGPFYHRAQDNHPVPVPEWWFNKELTGGGVLLDLGCHVINLSRWFFGEIIDIKSILGYRYNLDFEDKATCYMKFKNGQIGVINLGWFSQSYKFNIDFLGTIKNYTLSNNPPNKIITAMQMLITGKSSFNEPFHKALSYFGDCIIEDIEPFPSGLDGLNDMKTIFQAYENQIIIN